jgi:hypothetical protein
MSPLRELGRFQFAFFSLVDMYLPFMVRLLWPHLADVSLEDRLAECNRRLEIERAKQ